MRRAPGDVVRVMAGATIPVWIVLLVHGGVEHAGRLAARPVATAAACGVAVLVAATKPVERGAADVVALVVVWTAITLGLTAGLGDLSTIPLVVGVAVAVGAVGAAVLQGDTPTMPAVLATTGTALVVAGFAIAGERAAAFGAAAFDDSAVAIAVALVGVAVVLVGALDAEGPTPLVVAALAVAVVVAPHADTPATIVVPAGVAALVAAWFDRRALAVALGSVAALAVAPPAGLLLAGAAIVCSAVPSSPALLAGVPCAAALATTATHDPSTATIAAAVTAALVAVLLTVGRDLRVAPIPVRSVPAALLGADLTVAPGTWTWAGDAGLGHWDRGAGIALAAGLLAVVAGARAGIVIVGPTATAHDSATDAEAGMVSALGRRALVVALGLLGLALLALLRSSLRSV